MEKALHPLLQLTDSQRAFVNFPTMLHSIFRRYDDKNFSFTDYISFALMKRLNLEAALAFDEHFTKFGLLRVP